MHYKNGRPAKVGDRVVGKDCSGNPVSGVVVGTTPGSTTCNLQIAPATNVIYATAGETVHLDDALNPAPYTEPAAVPAAETPATAG